MNIISDINEIAEKMNLWQETKKSALKAIEIYIAETLVMDFPNLNKLSKDDFEFTEKIQSLIFWKNGNEVFVLRTTYDLKLQKQGYSLSGYYSLDVNEKGEFVDDWLVLNESNVG